MSTASTCKLPLEDSHEPAFQSVYPTSPELALLAAADWPCLNILDLACNYLIADFIAALAHANWPVLKSMMFDDMLDAAAVGELMCRTPFPYL